MTIDRWNHARAFVAAVAAGCVLVMAGCSAPPRRDDPAATLEPGWGSRMEARRAALEQAARGTAFEVSRTADRKLRIVAPGDASFVSGGFALQPHLRGVLDVLGRSLAGDPVARVAVVGHSDASGAAAANDALSLDRAQSVRDHLVGRGASALRIEATGRGAREPVADNASDAGRARNRRVEVLVRE